VSLEQLFLQLGICGAMLLVWFRIEGRRMEIAAKADERRTDTENKKVEAMEEGFRSLANMIADHAQADTRAHGVMAERLAAVESTLGMRKTPSQGVPVREVMRARTRDDR
jgi:hypothetical protein